MDRKTERALDVIKEFERLSGDRGIFESHWEEVAERVWPSSSKTFKSYGKNESKGMKKNQQVLDSAAASALTRFSAILDSLLTPSNQTWHRLTVADDSLARNRQVKQYFEDVNRLLFKYRYAPRANFASQNQQNYMSLGAFGTGAVFIDRLRFPGEMGIRYRNIHLGEIYFTENHQGIIDSAIRHYPLTARQVVQRWGKDNAPDVVKEALKINPEREFRFLHRVKMKESFDPERLDFRGMPFESIDVCVESKEEMEEGGFRTFPYAISRYTQAPGEVYGRGPAMEVLPAIKTLNEQKKVVLKQGHRATDPVIFTHDDGVVDGWSLKPGSINSGGMTADGRQLFGTLPVGNIAITKELMDDEKAAINDAFLVTLFQILVETPAMTATEVLERTREKGILLAPTVGRQNSEYQGPLIGREIDVLASQGLLPPMPEALREAQGEYKIEYENPLSRIKRAEEAAGLNRAVETALSIANVTQNPAPLDHFNWDVIIPEISDIQGVPTRWMRARDEVTQIRQSRAQAAEAAERVAAAPGEAALISANAKAQKVANER